MELLSSESVINNYKGGIIHYELHLLVYLPCYNYTQKNRELMLPNSIHITSDLVCYGIKGGGYHYG